MAYHSYPFPSLDWAYQGFDFAGLYGGVTQQVADNMYADGVRFVGRYLYNGGKGATAQEIQYYLNAGIRIFFYYEVLTSDSLGGYQRGQQNGANCLALANALGVPQGTQIYCCCDTGVTDAQASGVVMDYLNGFANALPNYYTGIYGGANVMDACYTTYPQNCRVQAGAWGVQEFEPINIRQWLIATNNRAYSDGKLRIQNVSIDSNGYATWRGNPVDILSANSIENMWGDDDPDPPPTPPDPPEPPQPTTGNKMPFWLYLKLPL